MMKMVLPSAFLSLMALTNACSPDEFEGADPNGLPTVSGVDFQISVDQETNQMVASYTPAQGTYPIWIIDGTSYSTLQEVGYKNSEAGTHTIELKLGNRNGFSQASVAKTFTFNETKVDWSADFRRITEKEWRFANKEVAHLACGPVGGDGTGWWSAGPDEKKAFGMYDDRITFTADNRKGGTYSYNAGADGMTYVNTGTTKWGPSDADFDVAIGNKTSSWSFEVGEWTDADGKVSSQTYLQLAPNTVFPYISSDAQYENPIFRIEQLTAKKLVLIYEAPDKSIAWRFIFTSEAEEKEFSGFDPNSQYNMWKNVQYTMFFWYAPGWSQIADPGFEANGNDYTITLPEATTDQWQAQVAFKTTNISTSSANNYDFSCIINSDKDLNGATVKLVKDGNDEVFYFADRINLKAGEDYIFWKSDMPGIDMERVNLFFDFGGCQAGTHVNISNIVLKNHADDDGTVLPSDNPDGPEATVDWDPASSANLWAPVESGEAFISVTPWFANDGWSQIADPDWKHANGVWELTLPDGMGGSQWQGQFPINTSLKASMSKKYNFCCVVEADNDASGVTIKLTESDDENKHDDNFFFADRHNIKADQPYVYKAEGVSLPKNDAHALSLFFDFGGSPVGTHVKISKIYFEEAVSMGYDDADNLWKAVDDGSKFDAFGYYFADNNWSGIAYQAVKHNGDTYELTLPQGMGGSQWQGQFHIDTKLTASAAKQYHFQVQMEADADLPQVTIKLTDSGDDNYFFVERRDIPADEKYIFTAKNVTLAQGKDAETIRLFFDFGGSPSGAHVKISKIVFKEAK